MIFLFDSVKTCTVGEILLLRESGVILWKNPVKPHKVFTQKCQQRETQTHILLSWDKVNSSQAVIFNILVCVVSSVYLESFIRKECTLAFSYSQ